MKKFAIVLSVLVVIAVSAIVGWKVTSPAGSWRESMTNAAGVKTYSWRYKMTVEIDTPEGIKSGSSVREVTATFRPTGNTHPKDDKYDVHLSLNGEAVVVDLGDRGTVFAILSGPLTIEHGKTIPFYVFSEPEGATIAGAEYYSKLKDKRVLEPSFYPMFVTFKDFKDPKTVVPLLKFKSNGSYPTRYAIEEDFFPEYFGKGVAIKSVVLEMTNEDVTDIVEKYLPSFGKETGFWDWFGKLNYGDARRISPSDFK